jgi:hypothetical protein
MEKKFGRQVNTIVQALDTYFENLAFSITLCSYKRRYVIEHVQN